MADSRVSVRASVAFAWSLWSTRWREIWGVLALSSLDATVYLAGMFAQNAMLVVVGLVALFVTVLMSNGAVFRLAFADQHPNDPGFTPGAVGVQWGRMEWRMLGAALLLGVFMVILVLLALIALTAPLLGLAMSQGTPLTAMTKPEDVIALLGPKGRMMLEAGQVLLNILVIFVGVRLALYMPATADSGKLMVLSTWRLTRGNFWRILATLLVLSLPPVLIVSLAGASTGMTGTTTAMAPAEAFVWAIIGGVVYGGVSIPLTAAALAYYYRNLKPPAAPGA